MKRAFQIKISDALEEHISKVESAYPGLKSQIKKFCRDHEKTPIGRPGQRVTLKTEVNGCGGPNEPAPVYDLTYFLEIDGIFAFVEGVEDAKSGVKLGPKLIEFNGQLKAKMAK